MDKLLNEIRHCSLCKEHLPYAPRPIIQASASARILVIGQAPGMKVQQSGIPWDDASGDTLRSWLGVSRETFYNDKLLALIPMGFCYPGTGKSGDLPPRPECAPLWHQPVLESMPEVRLTLLIGQYAQAYYLKNRRKSTLTETVKSYQTYLPEYLPLPHPSPRNNIWQKKNSWFREDVLPTLQSIILPLLTTNNEY
ncbi:uracil-DNA glycosylase family protein [uncultured Imperialibacter sp.]|uniref:uracil-DNA glycosylase family protein n=1 Tax=uncultured Imperialibacter sp. TaxID=1672639 RepID=UPI0030D7385A|tara:strand:- start:20946 stop:21533 length:588 start_codon:yes stop_codon:yes gene_type:complete